MSLTSEWYSSGREQHSTAFREGESPWSSLLGVPAKVFTDSSSCCSISLQRQKVGTGGAWSPPVAHFHSFSLNVSCSAFKSNFSASFLSSPKLL